MVTAQVIDLVIKTMDRKLSSGALSLGFALALGLQAASPAAAWWPGYPVNVPHPPAPGAGPNQLRPGVPDMARAQPWAFGYPAAPAGQDAVQFWHYQAMPFGPWYAWSSTMPTSGLYVEQSQSPAGYLIRVRTGQGATPAIDLDVEGGFLKIQSRSFAGAGAGAGMQMQQAGWSTQWISLAADADVTAMQVQWGDGVVQIFIPRRH